jgi:LPXTG-motif cell wall-anchored protein
MSDESILSIVIGIILAISGFFIVTKRNKLKIIQKNKNGNNTISNSRITNESDTLKK